MFGEGAESSGGQSRAADRRPTPGRRRRAASTGQHTAGGKRRRPSGQRAPRQAEQPAFKTAVCSHPIGLDITLPQSALDNGPWIIASNQHKFSTRYISSAALKVLKKLSAAGYAAYLVGGGVRDVLLGKEPKDFDVATDAHPEQVRELFKRGRIIGRRFRLVHVYFRGEVIEVSTFRAGNEDAEVDKSEQPASLQSDNVYGTIEEDAWRRDFTINALYYNAKDNSLVDYTGGLRDLQQKLLRVIGDPRQRFHEDPVRMLRIIRLAAKLDLNIEPQAASLIPGLAHLLQHVPASRLFDEILKLLFHGHAGATYNLLKKYKLMQEVFPRASAALQQADDTRLQQLITQAVQVTDERYASGQSLNPGFLLSVFLWPLLMQQLQAHVASAQQQSAANATAPQNMQEPGAKDIISQVSFTDWQQMVRAVLREQVALKIPRRLTEMMRDIWDMQWQLQVRLTYKVRGIMHMRYFRAGTDFLRLRAQAGYDIQAMCDWWWQLRAAAHEQAEQMIAALPSSKRRRPRRRKKPKASAAGQQSKPKHKD